MMNNIDVFVLSAFLLQVNSLFTKFLLPICLGVKKLCHILLKPMAYKAIHCNTVVFNIHCVRAL